MPTQPTLAALSAPFSFRAQFVLRSLVAGAMLALALLSVAPAHALPRQPAGDSLCGIPGYAVDEPDVDWVMYNQGDFVSVGGHTWMCGSSGRWSFII